MLLCLRGVVVVLVVVAAVVVVAAAVVVAVAVFVVAAVVVVVMLVGRGKAEGGQGGVVRGFVGYTRLVRGNGRSGSIAVVGSGRLVAMERYAIISIIDVLITLTSIIIANIITITIVTNYDAFSKCHHTALAKKKDDTNYDA